MGSRPHTLAYIAVAGFIPVRMAVRVGFARFILVRLGAPRGFCVYSGSLGFTLARLGVALFIVVLLGSLRRACFAGFILVRMLSLGREGVAGFTHVR